MNAEWDNLIILDACRFEHFSKVNDISGKLEKVASLGSHTPEWMQENFSGRHGDTVCVAGNPYYSKAKLKEMFGRNPFHYVEDVWDYGWDEELGTVPPKKLLMRRSRFERNTRPRGYWSIICNLTARSSIGLI